MVKSEDFCPCLATEPVPLPMVCAPCSCSHMFGELPPLTESAVVVFWRSLLLGSWDGSLLLERSQLHLPRAAAAWLHNVSLGKSFSFFPGVSREQL